MKRELTLPRMTGMSCCVCRCIQGKSDGKGNVDLHSALFVVIHPEGAQQGSNSFTCKHHNTCLCCSVHQAAPSLIFVAYDKQFQTQDQDLSFHLCVYYGRPLSVSGRPCYILPMFI